MTDFKIHVTFHMFIWPLLVIPCVKQIQQYRLEGLGQMKNPSTSLGIEPRNLLTCSIVLQPTTLQHVPLSLV
jgi:hypothetical protein